MELYAIFRRNAWLPDELEEAAARSTAEQDGRQADLRHIRSYVLEEPGGHLGSICFYQATSPEAIREHARAADLPVSEIARVVDTAVVRPDPEPTVQTTQA